MATSDKTKEKPLWLLIEENFLELNLQDLSGENKEKAIKKIAGGLDTEGYNVSRNGGNMLQLRWAMDDMLNVGRPLLKDLGDSVAKFSLDDLADPYSVTNKLLDNLGGTWKELKKSDRRPEVVQIVEKAKLDLLVKKSKGLPNDDGIRFLIEEKVESQLIIDELGITEEKLAQVNADIEKENAEKARVVTLLEAVDGKSNEEKVKHLFDNNVSENLIIEMAKVDQGAIDSVKKAMEEELKEKQRLEEEAAAKKKAEAAGPPLEDIPPDDMLDHIEAIREILEFSDVEKEIRVMCEQSSIPQCLVDIAVSEPDKLDELEKKAEG